MSFTKVFLSDTLTDWVNKTNIISEDVGDLTLLGTVQDSDLVGAINELHDSINQLNTFVDPDTALVTSSSTVSGAINELDSARDSAAANMNQLNIDRDSAATNMNQLNIDRDSAALNINQLNADRDSAAININTLNTDRDSSAVAINTLFNRVDSIDNETNAPTGNLADLTDSISGASRNNLVAAINDTYGYATQIDANNITSNQKIGELVNLNTVNQNTVVDAINELHDSIDGIVSGNGGIDITHVDGIIVSHADTSSQADVSNSGTTFLQSVTFDSFGHTLSITSNTVSDASTSVKGIASFNQNDFSVTSGVVTVKQDGISYTQIDKVANPGDGEVLSYSAVDGKLKFVAQTGGGGGGDLVNVNQAAPDISGGLISGDSVNISIEDIYGYWELEVYTDSVREVSGTATSTLVVDADTDIIDTVNIKDDAITLDKIATNAVDSAQIVDDAVKVAKLDTSDTPNDGEVLSYVSSSGRMQWVAQPTVPVVGADAQAYDADLDAIAALAKTDGNIIVGNGTTWVAENGSTARTSLGLGGFSTSTYSQVTTTRLEYSSDTDTYIEWNTADQLKLIAGGVEMIHCVEGTTDYVDIVDRVRITAAGDFECEGDVIAYTTTTVSDRNLKEDIQAIESSLDKVKQLNGVTFKWKDKDEVSSGLIAQDVEKVLPQAVKDTVIRDGKEFKSLNYDGVVGLLVEAIKELSAKVEELENK